MFLLANKTRRPTPALEWAEIAAAVLGGRYDLSVVLIGDRRARTLNQTYRQKNKRANVLSFPLTPEAGELFINLAACRREHHKFERSYREHVGALFIHGLLHLKGLDHGSTMDAKEIAFLKRFLNVHQHRHRS